MLPLRRGVYEAPFVSTADETILVAINQRGQCIGERRIPVGASGDAEWADLLAQLDRLDPVPALRLVRAS